MATNTNPTTTATTNAAIATTEAIAPAIHTRSQSRFALRNPRVITAVATITSAAITATAITAPGWSFHVRTRENRSDPPRKALAANTATTSRTSRSHDASVTVHVTGTPTLSQRVDPRSIAPNASAGLAVGRTADDLRRSGVADRNTAGTISTAWLAPGGGVFKSMAIPLTTAAFAFTAPHRSPDWTGGSVVAVLITELKEAAVTRTGLICLTPASELRELLHAGRRQLIVTFRFYHCDYYRNVTIVAVRPAEEGTQRVDCMFRNGDVITLLLPTEESGPNVIGIVNPGRMAPKVVALKAPPPLQIRALEEHLRWQEHQILWGPPNPTADGPFTQHPRLGGLARTVREQIADHIGSGRPIMAIKVLRDSCPGMSIGDAATVVEAQRLYGGD
ncbi:hypothetical protein [Mycolicibacterium vanbaalenii]|nr:hypothetical protein [Mycolicibacterium vanbaalenii]MCV7126977.1 hypothetical protein [Mycolicibacterium vanbaalenii PYR-1]